MARREGVWTGKRMRASDGAESAKYKKAAAGKKPAPVKEKTKEKAIENTKEKPKAKAKAAAKASPKGTLKGTLKGTSKESLKGKAVGKADLPEKQERKRKPAAGDRAPAGKGTVLPAERKTVAKRIVARAEGKRPAAKRISSRTRRENRRIEAAMRDRRRAVRRGADWPTIGVVLLTVIFEVFGFLLLAVRSPGAMDSRALTLMAVMAPLAILTALVLPRFLPMDPMIMALTNFLCGVGAVILYTVSPDRGVRQVTFYVLGLALMSLISLIVARVRRYKGWTILAMLLGIAALLLPLAFGQWQNGAKNWVELPGFGSFQPSELVKLSLVLAMAYYFSAHRTVLQMMPAILFAGACLLLLMLQRDLGTALIYYMTTLVMFYAACGNVPLTVAGLGGGCAAAVLGYKMFAHVKVRVAMWRNPWSDPLDKGYQIIQALLAIGSGGLFGVGLGQGTPEKIPAYYNDFIFAVICEQMGIIFGLLVIVIYVLLIVRGVTVITRSRRSMHMLLGCGVLAMLAIQTFMIVAGVIKMIPLTGVTMPFLSYGGSSLLSCLAMIGILHGVSGRAQEDLEEDVLSVKG